MSILIRLIKIYRSFNLLKFYIYFLFFFSLQHFYTIFIFTLFYFIILNNCVVCQGWFLSIWFCLYIVNFSTFLLKNHTVYMIVPISVNFWIGVWSKNIDNVVVCSLLKESYKNLVVKGGFYIEYICNIIIHFN